MIEVDQSVKVEQTNKGTVLAMANTGTYMIVIPARVKRRIIQILKGRGKSHSVACYQVFAAGLFILLQPFLPKIVKHREQIVIDLEYPGHDDKIRGMLLRFMHEQGFSLPKDRILFARVGKSSRAHQAGWEVQCGKADANRVVSIEDLLKLF